MMKAESEDRGGQVQLKDKPHLNTRYFPPSHARLSQTKSRPKQFLPAGRLLTEFSI